MKSPGGNKFGAWRCRFGVVLLARGLPACIECLWPPRSCASKLSAPGRCPLVQGSELAGSTFLNLFYFIFFNIFGRNKELIKLCRWRFGGAPRGRGLSPKPVALAVSQLPLVGPAPGRAEVQGSQFPPVPCKLGLSRRGGTENSRSLLLGRFAPVLLFFREFPVYLRS